MVQVRRRIVSHGREVERLQDAQHFQRGDPLVARREFPHAIAAERHRDRRDPVGGVAAQIVERDESTHCLEMIDDALSDGAAVERGDAAVGDHLQRACEIRVAEPLPRVRRASVAEVRRRRPLVAPEEVGLVAPLLGDDGRDREAVARVGDGGLQRLGESTGAMRAQEQVPSGECAGDGDGHRALLRAFAEAARLQRFAGHEGARASTGVERHEFLFAGEPDDGEHVAAEAGHVRFGDAEDGGGGNRGVDGVAPLAQDFEGRRRGKRLAGGDGGVRRVDGGTASHGAGALRRRELRHGEDHGGGDGEDGTRHGLCGG
jgi:hypothetical protein